MFRSLHMKLVLILVLMIISVMAVVGTFLINSVSTFYLDSFYEQMQSVFTTDTILSMEEAAAENGADGLLTIIDAHRSRLGIDDYRNYYILDGQGRFLDTDKQYHLRYGRGGRYAILCVGQHDGCRGAGRYGRERCGGLHCVHRR